MTEEPYRWVEAVANRREYIETQLASGSPIAAVGCGDGILFVTVGSTRQKVFEIYDRIAMGAIGHPGDIERLRMAAIELASTEGFTRSAADVSLRRLAYYSLSPVLKAAFEQVYGKSRDEALRGNQVHRWLESVHPEDRGRVLDDLRQVRAGVDVVDT